LAKELGVPSKAIVEKCLAEGMEMKTGHMSPLTAGQAATVREWFSEGSHTTAVETSKPVDLDKIRVKRKKGEGQEAGEAVGETATQVITEEPPAIESEQPEPAAAAAPAEPVAEEPPVTVETAVPTVAETALPVTAEPVAPSAVEEAPAQPAAPMEPPAAAAEVIVEQPEAAVKQDFPTPVMHVPVIPKDIKPAGPMLHKPMRCNCPGRRWCVSRQPMRMPCVRPRKARPDVKPADTSEKKTNANLPAAVRS
jgi:hypothetical protein